MARSSGGHGPLTRILSHYVIDGRRTAVSLEPSLNAPRRSHRDFPISASAHRPCIGQARPTATIYRPEAILIAGPSLCLRQTRVSADLVVALMLAISVPLGRDLVFFVIEATTGGRARGAPVD